MQEELDQASGLHCPCVPSVGFFNLYPHFETIS